MKVIKIPDEFLDSNKTACNYIFAGRKVFVFYDSIDMSISLID